MIHKNYLDILVLLHDYGYMSARDISDSLGIDRSNVYDYLEKLVEVNWVRKDKGSFLRSCPVYKYYLTEKGIMFLRSFPVEKALDGVFD